MLTLIIDTSTERGVIALFDNNVLLEYVELPFGLTSSKSLLPELEHLLTKHRLQAADLALIVAGIGPGSYTGIRVGAMVAKTLSYANQIPLVGVCSLDGFTPNTDASFAAVIDAKISGLYVKKGIRKNGKILWHTEAEVMPLQDAHQELENTEILVTPHHNQLQRKLQHCCWYERAPDPLSLLDSGLKDYHQGNYSSDGHLELLYLRKTQAELTLTHKQ